MSEVVTSPKRILAFFDHFYPSVRSGGPAKSSLGFAEQLSLHYEITIVTSNHDFGDRTPYPAVIANTATPLHQFVVYYLDYEGSSTMEQLIHSNPDYIYLNSFFSFHHTIKPLWLIRKLKPSSKVVLAPRGEVALSALQKSRLKKQIYSLVYRLLLEPGNLLYQASSLFEKVDIEKYLPNRDIQVAPNLRPKSDFLKHQIIYIEKRKDELRICLIARIHPIKNIDRAIEFVSQLNNPRVIFDIYGFKEDEQYYQTCKKLSQEAKCQVHLLPALAADEVIPVIGRYHLFFLPSQGENFGHSILESFIAARPVIISDQTPWRELDSQLAGFDLPIDSYRMVDKLRYFLTIDDQEFQSWCLGARQMAIHYFNNEDSLQSYYKLFQ